MQEAVPAGQGAMSAVLGLEPARVKAVCESVEAASGKVVSPANYNEPAQTVIAGDAGAVELAGAKLKEAGARRVLPLPVSAPFHCALMAPVKPRLEKVLRAVAWQEPRVPVVTNVEAKADRETSRVVPLLVEQVTSPVRSIEWVEELVRLGVTRMVEVGPGKVLSGLVRRMDKRWQPPERRGPRLAREDRRCAEGSVTVYDFQGKTALVTGGSRGIGRAIAVTLARRGTPTWP